MIMALIKKEIIDISKYQYWFDDDNEKIIEIKEVKEEDFINKSTPIVIWPFVLI